MAIIGKNGKYVYFFLKISDWPRNVAVDNKFSFREPDWIGDLTFKHPRKFNKFRVFSGDQKVLTYPLQW